MFFFVAAVESSGQPIGAAAQHDGQIIMTATLPFSARPTTEEASLAETGISSACLEGESSIFSALASDWRNLCDTGLTGLPFARPEWVETYARFSMSQCSFLLAYSRGAAGLTAALPLGQEKIRFAKLPALELRGISEVFGWPTDFAVAPGAQGNLGLEGVWKILKNRKDWDLIEFNNAPEGGSVHDLLSLAERDGFPVAREASCQSPYFPLAGAGANRDPLQAVASAKLRESLKRRFRQASARGELRLVAVNQPDADALKTFFELEAAGWKGKMGTAIQSYEKGPEFYRCVTAEAARFGYLSIYLLTLSSKVIAASLGLTYRGCHYGLKSGFDQEFAAYSPGQLLILELLRDCQAHGLSEVNFMGDPSAWKLKWTTLLRPHAHCYIFQKSAYGRLLHFLKFRVQPWVARFRRQKPQGIAGERPQSVPEN